MTLESDETVKQQACSASSNPYIQIPIVYKEKGSETKKLQLEQGWNLHRTCLYEWMSLLRSTPNHNNVYTTDQTHIT